MQAENCCDDCDNYEVCITATMMLQHGGHKMHDETVKKLMEEPPTPSYITYDRKLNLLRPDLIEVHMDDVFRTLPKINRFNGHTSEPYSVARHSISCVNAVIKEYKVRDTTLLIATLLHDAPEAYIGDIVNPLKDALSWRKVGARLGGLEEILMTKFLALFNFTPSECDDLKDFAPLLKYIDKRMMVTEASVLTKHKLLPEIPRFDYSYVQPHTWQTDEYVFKALYNDLAFTRRSKGRQNGTND